MFLLLQLPEKLVLKYLLMTNAVFILAGMAMVSIGIYLKVTAPPKGISVDPSEYEGNIIAVGCFLLALGTAGVTGAVLKKRNLLIVLAVSLGSCVLILSVFLITFCIAIHTESAKIKAKLQAALVTEYGNNSDTSSRTFEVLVNEFQNLKSCCGWSGDEQENIFLKTPWYAKNNVKGHVRTVPDSCCIQTGDQCRTAINLVDAREKGWIYPRDCLAMIIFNLQVFLWSTVITFVLLMLLLIAALAFTVLLILQRGTNNAE